MKRSRREFTINVVIHSFIFINNQITPFPCFTFIPKTGIIFYCAESSKTRKKPWMKIALEKYGIGRNWLDPRKIDQYLSFFLFKPASSQKGLLVSLVLFIEKLCSALKVGSKVGQHWFSRKMNVPLIYPWKKKNYPWKRSKKTLNCFLKNREIPFFTFFKKPSEVGSYITRLRWSSNCNTSMNSGGSQRLLEICFILFRAHTWL